jgi:hypothetical protein
MQALAVGGVYGTLRAVTAPRKLSTDLQPIDSPTDMTRALSMDLRLTTDGIGMESAGTWSVWNRSTAVATGAAFGYADTNVTLSGESVVTGDVIVYTPYSAPAADGSPSLVVNLTSINNKAEVG